MNHNFREFLIEKINENNKTDASRIMDDFKKEYPNKIGSVISNGARTGYAGFVVYHKFGSADNLVDALNDFAEEYFDKNIKYYIKARNINPSTLSKETLEKNKREGFFVTNISIDFGKK